MAVRSSAEPYSVTALVPDTLPEKPTGIVSCGNSPVSSPPLQAESSEAASATAANAVTATAAAASGGTPGCRRPHDIPSVGSFVLIILCLFPDLYYGVFRMLPYILLLWISRILSLVTGKGRPTPPGLYRFRPYLYLYGASERLILPETQSLQFPSLQLWHPQS